MSWSTPLTAVANATLTAAQWNASVRDNLAETAPAKATTAGGIFVATGLNAIAQRIVTSSYVSPGLETTTSTTYTTLTTPGPVVTVTTGANALVLMSCTLFNNSAGGQSFMALVVSGASSLAASDTKSMRFESSAASDTYSTTYAYLETSLTPGSNVFTANYKIAVGGTSTFTDRRLTVLPL